MNDGAEAVDLTVTALAVTMDGSTRELAKATVSVGPDAAKLALAIPAYQVSAAEMLAYVWSQGDVQIGGDVFAPKPYKAYDLLPANLSMTVAATASGYDLTLTADTLALFVAVEPDQPGRFSDNAFTVFPGHPATITFTPQVPGIDPHFTIRDLHSATYGTH